MILKRSRALGVRLKLDYCNGISVADNQVSGWVKSKIEESLAQDSDLEIVVGSTLILIGFRYWVKKMGIESGYVTIHADGRPDGFIDEDGNPSHCFDSDVMSDFLLFVL